MQPLVSICIPTYNRAKLVQCAIASAQAQTYPNVEIIVTDNCSTDNTEEVVRAIAAKDPRVRYIRNETNVGPTRNWQIAVNAAKGEYCKILFSDDEIAAEFVSLCIEQFNKGRDIAFAVTDGVVGQSFDDGEPWHGSRQPEGFSDSKDYILDYLMWDGGADSPACALFRTQDILKIIISNPFFVIDKYMQNGAGPDCLIFLNAALSHAEIAHIAKPLTFFRSNGDSISFLAHQSTDSVTLLLNCYVKARYQFMRGLTTASKCNWYLRFLATLTGGVRWSHVRNLIATDLELRGHHPFTILDFAIGCVLRQYKTKLVRPLLGKILSARDIARSRTA